MHLTKFWRPAMAVCAVLLSGVVHATNIVFSESTRSETYARVLFQFDDESGNVSNGISGSASAQLQQIIEISEFEGKSDSNVKFTAPPGEDTKQIVVIGLGDPSEFDRADAVALGGKIAQMFTHEDVQKVDVLLRGLETNIEHPMLAATIAHGISLGSYRFNKYLQEASTPNNDFHVVVASEGNARSQYAKLQAVEQGVFLARDLVNTNGGELTPVEFAEAAKSELEGLDIDVNVFNDQQIKDMNMGLLFAVGQGSITGSRLVVAHYKGSDDKPIALVGKGITFDSGGYNIKTHKSIAWMKGDMSGAAAVLGTIKALAEQKANVNVVALMPLAKNMVSEKSLLPGDIITSMSGKSVEILNTDAEGRLVMADAMWYAQEQYDPAILVNIATLTGSKIRAIGDRFAAIFSEDEELVKQLSTSGKMVNEQVWRLPLAYGDMLKSTLADTTNIGSGGPGATTAAMFLHQFVQEDTRWVSLDIAGNELAHKTKNEVPAGGVGYGVRLLTEWVTAN